VDQGRADSLKSPRTARRIIDLLASEYPDADTELHFRNPFELLVATVLSAQSTDARVNMVTPALFARYPDARALADAAGEDVERLVVSTGFFRQKTRALLGMARKLVADHQGRVPRTLAELAGLPGVGRKTANVVLGHAFGIPGLPVDRHVLRVSNRIGLAEGDDPEAVEAQLCALLPKDRWTLASDVQILHGRRVCRPRPRCDVCAVQEHCDYYRSGGVTAAGRSTAARRPRTPRRRPA
jgi:endonuclease-3